MFRWFVAALFLFTVAQTVIAARWERGWMSISRPQSAVRVADTEAAQRLSDAVDSSQTADIAIEAWRAVAAAQPDDAQGWTHVSSLLLLKGAAYQSHKRERLQTYHAALNAAERAMATNEAFTRRAAAGEPIWQAAQSLTSSEMGAINFWVTGVFYIFRDCLGPVGRIRHGRLMNDARGIRWIESIPHGKIT